MMVGLDRTVTLRMNATAAALCPRCATTTLANANVLLAELVDCATLAFVKPIATTTGTVTTERVSAMTHGLAPPVRLRTLAKASRSVLVTALANSLKQIH